VVLPYVSPLLLTLSKKVVYCYAWSNILRHCWRHRQ